MDSEILTNILYIAFILGIVLIACIISLQVKYSRLKQKNYFLNRDRERYAETIYASKDGYFAFIYPDQRIKDPRQSIRERCSRRLAVMLNLKNGRQSTFNDVLDVLYKDDARKLKKYLTLMQEEGIAFEDTFFVKTTKRHIRIFGSRINGLDGNLYCDMLWFRDLSPELIKINELEEDNKSKEKHIKVLVDLIDNLNVPVYLRDENLDIKASNKKYEELLSSSVITEESKNLSDIIKEGYALAKQAVQTNKAQKRKIQVISSGKLHYFELTEMPFHSEDRLDKIGTVGMLLDVTELDSVKRNFKIHQNAHLEVLSALGTAFAIFNTKSELIFYNKSFVLMWHLEAESLEQGLSYASFLNIVRNKRLLPEVSDFKTYKSEEEKLFSDLIEPKENLLHLPDGRTIRRVVSQHPNGLIFAYEDVSDRLAAERTIGELMNLKQEILGALFDAVLVFDLSGHLRFYNSAYTKLFKTDEKSLQNLPSADDVFEMQRSLFLKVENFDNLKQNMLRHVFEIYAAFKLECDDKTMIDVTPYRLSDETILVCYTPSNR